MKRIGNELDTVHFSLKKASQLVKEIGRQALPLSQSLTYTNGEHAQALTES
jgi:hypothetical protein